MIFFPEFPTVIKQTAKNDQQNEHNAIGNIVDRINFILHTDFSKMKLQRPTKD